eukprot:TRINITY_DN22894_c0_g3_i1.p4 TRINITY_DN22894_c0_g3~~TRINITY_DN22894_c0_g3_i1.p4  ORF type:complete len:116 (-),score=6.83 TRINITY_DN22894_c0_g3_i1:102-449(-)
MYGVSKCAETSYTLWLARVLKDKGISVNAVCPGWCQTEMSSNSGPKTAADGADTPVWLALQHPSPTGQFFQERLPFEWQQAKQYRDRSSRVPRFVCSVGFAVQCVQTTSLVTASF